MNIDFKVLQKLMKGRKINPLAKKLKMPVHSVRMIRDGDDRVQLRHVETVWNYIVNVEK